VTHAPANNGRAVLRIAIVIGIAQFGFATVLPLLPLHLTEHLGASVKLVGVVVATFALVETFFKTALGGITDRMGRRPIIVCGLILSCVAPIIMAVLRSPVLFVPLRLIDGMGSAALWPAAAAAIADITTPDRRATGMATLNMFFLAGLAVGFWRTLDEIKASWREERRFLQQRPQAWREELLERWRRAVEKV